MVITQPTVDDFSDTTVMRVIRKIVNYICSDSGLVAQINNNDITGFTSSYTNNILKIDATKGDGSTLPVCNLTIQGGSGTSNPYPTAISGTVGEDGNITIKITMSEGNPVTATINMSYFASTADLSDLQEQVTGIKPTVTINTEVSPPTISVSVNGTTSTANLPSSGSPTLEIIEEADLDIATICSKLYNLNIGDTFALVGISLTDNTTMYLNGTFGGSTSAPALKDCGVSGTYHGYTISSITIRPYELVLAYYTFENKKNYLTIDNTNYKDCYRLIICRYS